MITCVRRLSLQQPPVAAQMTKNDAMGLSTTVGLLSASGSQHPRSGHPSCDDRRDGNVADHVCFLGTRVYSAFGQAIWPGVPWPLSDRSGWKRLIRSELASLPLGLETTIPQLTDRGQDAGLPEA